MQQASQLEHVDRSAITVIAMALLYTYWADWLHSIKPMIEH